VSEFAMSEGDASEGDASEENASETTELPAAEEISEVMVLEEIADPELTLPVWEATGHVEIDSALELMQSLDPDSIHTHAEVLGEVHGRLHELMSQLDR
jgi:hypothetical protein